MTQQRKKSHHGRSASFAIAGILIFMTLIAVLLRNADVVLFNPKGFIAGEQRSLFLLSAAILMAIAVPTLFLFYFYAWKYRETNENASYEPEKRHGKSFIITIWAIPIAFMFILAGIMWPATHKLEPQKVIAADAKPLTIQVVAMRWKWLFIYPEHNIATVNFIEIPTDTPVRFELTADEAPMSSFWIPHLGGQLYAMTGHVNQLNLIAEMRGDYQGSTAEINGPGFAGMKFVTRAVSQAEFDEWTHSINHSFEGLTTAEYNNLLKPSENHPYEYFSEPEAGLYDKVVMKYMGSHHTKPVEYHGTHE